MASLAGCEELKALKECDVRFNKVATWDMLLLLCKLEELEALMLEGNPLLSYYATLTPYYRKQEDMTKAASVVPRLMFCPQCTYPQAIFH